jgi:glycyl-tRNA synthetase beta chain
MTDDTQNAKVENGNLKLDTGNPESGIRNSEREVGAAVLVEEQPVIENGQAAIPEPSSMPKEKSKPSITLPLLLEVGCEEIPARFLRDAEKSLGERVQAALFDAGLIKGLDLGVVITSPGSGLPDIELSLRRGKEREVRTYSTPRRLVVHVPALMAQQPDKVEEILGPPVKVAVDAAGRYTRAAESFAQKNSASVDDLARTTTPKGEYLSLRKTTPRRPAAAILAEILPGAILGLTFPKSMYWTEKSAPRFVRPIRWIVALLGEGKRATTVDFTILGVKTGNFTFGHRAKSSKPIPVNSFRNYTKKLAQSLVEVDYNRRREGALQAELAVDPAAGKIVQDEWLVDWIANSTEWPLPMLGSFDARFLHLPREILITVMRDHQRYFAVEDEQGNLRPYFVAVLNMASDEQGLIRLGHQRVLTARFRDAEFFWTADQKIPLRDRVPLLDKVTYQARLGSYGAKVHRTKAIAEYVCAILGKSGELKPEKTAHVLRAVDLCKCDLTAQMVQEFTELQGIVGGLYAKAQGEPEEVATAIYDHYLPAGAEGNSPRTLVGALVSLADKVDSVVAGFAAGYEPTGSSDPFALRRQANGIIKVILENNLALNLKEVINKAIDVLDIEWRKPREEVQAKVLDFFAERLRYYFETIRGFRYDTVRAVVAAGAEQPADAQARAEAMEALRGGEDFEALSAAAKRIRNILAKSATASDWQAGDVAPELLSEVQEKKLAEAYEKVAGEVDRHRASREYRQALEKISTLRPAVDRFFDAVLVMAEDREVRQNRLRLLKKLDELFSGIAHFAEIAQGQ